MDNIGSLYGLGQGVRKDNAKAVEWKTKAANLGYAQAQYSLGTYYDNGIGVPNNDKKAVEWYKKAAVQGNAKAQKALTDRGIKW